MNWDAIAAIGEIAAFLAVLVTLVYLSRQLSRSNDYAQASSIHDTNSLFVQVFSLLVQDPDMALIYHRALTKEKLNTVDSVRFASFLNAYFAWSEDMYCQAEAKLGFVVYTDRRSKQLLMQEYGYWGRLLETDVGIDWWEDVAAHLFSDNFVQDINEIRSNAAK